MDNAATSDDKNQGIFLDFEIILKNKKFNNYFFTLNLV